MRMEECLAHDRYSQSTGDDYCHWCYYINSKYWVGALEQFIWFSPPLHFKIQLFPLQEAEKGLHKEIQYHPSFFYSKVKLIFLQTTYSFFFWNKVCVCVCVCVCVYISICSSHIEAILGKINSGVLDTLLLRL